MLARVLLLTGVVPALLGLALWIGLGVSRQLGPLQVTAGALLFGLLPTAGIWALLGRGRWASGVSCWLWPMVVFTFLPAFFPGEMPELMGTGLATLAAAGGSGAAKEAGRVGESLPRLGVWEGQLPAPAASKVADCRPASVVGDEAVALPYEGQGHSLVIPVQFGDQEIPMLFDTGATVTTMDRATLARIGVEVRADAPEIKLRTANGERTAQLVQVPEVWIGGMRVAPVTVGICEECADGRVAGLLGLNVSGLFLVTLDTVRKEVLFRERTGSLDRVVDVAMWLSLEALATVFPDGRVEVGITATNKSDRPIASAEVGIHCQQGSYLGNLKDIPARRQATTRVRLPRSTDCEGYTVSLEHAQW